MGFCNQHLPVALSDWIDKQSKQDQDQSGLPLSKNKISKILKLLNSVIQSFSYLVILHVSLASFASLSTDPGLLWASNFFLPLCALLVLWHWHRVSPNQPHLCFFASRLVDVWLVLLHRSEFEIFSDPLGLRAYPGHLLMDDWILFLLITHRVSDLYRRTAFTLILRRNNARFPDVSQANSFLDLASY